MNSSLPLSQAAVSPPPLARLMSLTPRMAPRVLPRAALRVPLSKLASAQQNKQASLRLAVSSVVMDHVSKTSQ